MDTEDRQTEDQRNAAVPSAVKVVKISQRCFALVDWVRNGRNRRSLWGRSKFAWRAFSSFVLSAAAVAAVLYFGWLLFVRVTSHAIEINPISVTKDLNDEGLYPYGRRG